MTLRTLTSKPYALFFQAVANRNRMQIVDLLRERGGMNVLQIRDELGLEQSQVSHNLRCLAFCGLVSATVEGKSRIYSINEQTIIPLLKIVDQHLKKHARNIFKCDVLER